MSIDDFFIGRFENEVNRKVLFADREQERLFLLGRIRSCSDTATPQQVLMDYQRPALNISAVTGQGGIGKSALLKAAAREFVAQESEKVSRVHAYVDFSDFENHNFEIVLMRMRAALAKTGKKWPAFDLAFGDYWARKHPGVPLARFLDGARFLGEEQRQIVIDQFTTVLDSVLGGFGVISSGYRLANLLRKRIQESQIAKRLRNEYPPFGVVIDEPDPDRMLGYLAALLAYDLQQVKTRRRVEAVCLLDTFEYIQQPNQGRGSLEDLTSRLVYLMPNVAFISASRLPLAWHTAAGSAKLTYGGADRWPELATGGGHLQLGGLDAVSAESLLRDSLEFQGRPAMPTLVRERIIHGANGLPLHLELSINWYRDLLVRGATPSAAQVATTFPELVFRILRDLPDEERDLLRGAALLETFNEELLKLAVPRARGHHFKRFVERSFVNRTPNSWLPYSLHDNLRRAVLEHDQLTEDAWTTEEWAAQAERAIAWLEESALEVWGDGRLTSHGDLGETSRRAVAATLLAAKATVDHGVDSPGLGELAFTVTQFGYHRAFESMPAPEAAAGRPSLKRMLTVSEILSNPELTGPECYEAIKPHVTLQDNPLDHFVASAYAAVAEVIGDYPSAEKAYQSLTNSRPALAYYGALGLVGNALRSGRLATALNTVPTTSEHPLRRTAALDVQGHIHLQGGEHAKAADFFEAALQQARAGASPIWAARTMRHLAIACSFAAPDRTLALVPQARDLNESLEEHIGVAQCDQALAVAWAWKGDRERAYAELRRAQSYGIDPISIGHPGMIEVLFARAAGNDEAVTQAVEGVFRGRRSPTSRPHVWLAVTALWADRLDLADFDRVEWYDSTDAARARWLDVPERLARIWNDT
ncbi:hypothetical protein [Actinomadura sp. WMMA1423]|uniref:hypothetical protein n=1 Tax=Actinomadura sp. WMMA1423 TaxID=2591108 RepID=UPI0011462992|nr:hypothetical protein [Actinomadura sp. WMMA1423]